MSTTQTSHEPGPAELDAPASAPHEDGHGPAGETLGAVDVRAWGAMLLGVTAGLIVVLCLVITTTLLATPSV